MYMYNCDFFVCFRAYLFVWALLAKILKLRRYGKPVRTRWSRFELDPSTVARVTCSQSFFSRREWVRRFPGFVCMRPILYVLTGKKLSLLPSLASTQQPRTYTTGRLQNMQRTRRYHAAAHNHQQATPCVCDTPICAVLLWLQVVVVFIGFAGP